MTIKKLDESEILAAGVSSLSNRPTAPYAFGGEGLTPTALKARFDLLPRLIAERLNALIGLLLTAPDLDDPAGDSLAETIRSGIPVGDGQEHTLADFLREVLDGTASGYLRVGDESLAEAMAGKEPKSRVRVMAGEGVIELESDLELRLGELGRLRVTLPSTPREDFAVTLVFDSKAKEGDSYLACPGEIKWSGDDVINGQLVILGGRHYTCMIWYDGGYQGIARSVPR